MIKITNRFSQFKYEAKKQMIFYSMLNYLLIDKTCNHTRKIRNYNATLLIFQIYISNQEYQMLHQCRLLNNQSAASSFKIFFNCLFSSITAQIYHRLQLICLSLRNLQETIFTKLYCWFLTLNSRHNRSIIIMELNHKLFLLSLCVFLTFSQTFQTTQTTQTYTVGDQTYQNGGLGSIFSVGPSNPIVQGLTASSFNIFVTPGATMTLNLANGLIDNTYQIYPLTGFNYSYRIDGLPSWIKYDGGQTRALTLTPPASWNSAQQINIFYSDSRGKNANLPVTLSPGNTFVVNQIAFVAANSLNLNPNTLTLVFPLFTVTNSNLNSITSHNVGALTNVATRPWTTLSPVSRSSSYLLNTGINNQAFTNTNANVNIPNTNIPNTIVTTPILSNPTIINPIVTNPNTVTVNPNAFITNQTTTTTTTSGSLVPGQTVFPNNQFTFATNNNPGTGTLNQTTTTVTNTPVVINSSPGNIANIIPTITQPNTIPAAAANNLINSTSTTTTTAWTNPSTPNNLIQPSTTPTGASNSIPPIVVTNPSIPTIVSNSVSPIVVTPSVSPVVVSNTASTLPVIATVNQTTTQFSSGGTQPTVTVTPPSTTVGFQNGNTVVRTTNQTVISGIPADQVNQYLSNPIITPVVTAGSVVNNPTVVSNVPTS